MYVTRLDKVEKSVPEMEGAKGIYKQIPLSRKDGVPTFSFRVFTIEPGGHTPFHQHAFEHMNYVISGEGILVAEDGGREIREGDFSLVLPGEKHQYKNSSENQNLVIICAVSKEYE
ncbi:MAG: cupin domain-containing protein [Dehalococcoidia bacterium]|nr:cupin domain-containing protein [Dehalococcoidia bacterium]RLC62452.1 MAG: cupin [Chloroflexota bacterium]